MPLFIMTLLLHFIFVIKDEVERIERRSEFTYIKKMANFYVDWIQSKFGVSYTTRCDELVTGQRNIFQRIDTHTLVRDHEYRGVDAYHFYLANFKPLWTDCTCEGYHAENFGMILWQRPHQLQSDEVYLAEKNCTTVSHEILHELLRKRGYKRFTQDVHDVWTRHLFDHLEFEQYGDDYKTTEDKPVFLTMDTSQFGLK